MVPIRLFRVAVTAAAAALLAGAIAPVSAAGRQPLVLDTQRGISDGQPGIVLQNAPLSRAPMVNAPPVPRPAELAPDAAPPMIVAPYVEVPGAGGRPRPPTRPRWPSGAQ